MNKSNRRYYRKPLREGAGGGYTVKLKGIQLADDIRITKKNKDFVAWECSIKPCTLDYWSADSYYWYVDSKEDILTDNYEFVNSFDDESDKEVIGGKMYGEIDTDYLEGDQDILDYLAYIVSGEADVKASYGGGYGASYMSDPMEFEDEEYGIDVTLPNDPYGEVFVKKLVVNAPNISEDINWMIDNWYQLDDIIDTEDFNESVRRHVRESQSFDYDRMSAREREVYDTVMDCLYGGYIYDAEGDEERTNYIKTHRDEIIDDCYEYCLTNRAVRDGGCLSTYSGIDNRHAKFVGKEKIKAMADYILWTEGL